MAQFEYNDLHKFYVSVGVTLIGFTFLFPWLFLRENFDLLIKSEDLLKYTSEAQHIIRQRQAIVGWFSIIIPIISCISLSIGIYLSYKGINGWRRIQLLIEEREKLTNQKLSVEIYTLSHEEKIEKVNKEVQLLQRDVTPQEQTKINILEQKTFKENYLINEKKFHQLIEKSLSAKYKIYNDFRVENNEYDLLLKSPLMMESDYIIDIKYSEARIGQTYLRSCINQINSSLKYYKERIKGNVKARIVLLLTKKAIQEKSLNVKAVYNYTIDLVDYENKNLRSSDVYIAIFEVEKMESYSEIEIIEKLKL